MLRTLLLLLRLVKLIASIILKLLGWKLKGKAPNHLKKCVIIQAPHTSNWDFVIGKLAGYAFEINPNIFIKKSLFFFPLGWLLNKLGGIPVDRNKRANLVEEMAYEMVVREELKILLTPEGTRSYNPNWKKGFYYIAKAAQVPVVPVYIDFSTKTVGWCEPFPLSKDVDTDIAKLKEFFKQFKGKNPENGVK